jgi:hypothetical protein
MKSIKIRIQTTAIEVVTVIFPWQLMGKDADAEQQALRASHIAERIHHSQLFGVENAVRREFKIKSL